MAFPANEVSVRALPAVFRQPYISHLKITLNWMFIIGLQSPNIYSQRMDISMFFPTHLLQQSSLCQLHIQNSLLVSGLHLSLNVCGELAWRMSGIATLIRPSADHRDHWFKGFFFRADIKMVTTVNAMPYDFRGYQITDQRAHNPIIAASSNMGEINSNNNDDRVIIFDEVTSAEGSSSQTSPSPNLSITRRLQQIEKLRKTEHEVLNTENANIKDQLGDWGVCCSIWLEDFLGDGINEKKEKNMKLGRFGCTHLYHLTCILQWLNQNDSCPLCRRQLLS